MKQKLFFLLICLLNAVHLLPANASMLSEKPRVSIITSLYNGDDFIVGFLADIVQQTIFNQSELIIINAHSPGNEEAIIKEYAKQFPNIIYVKLDNDPGLYSVWNMAIRMARADFITNANVDDRRNPQALEMHVQTLENNPDIDLVYSDYYITQHPNETFSHKTTQYRIKADEFKPELMYQCLPGPQPTWRKDMHERYGFFDETFQSGGDFEMWNRAVSKGSRFKKVPVVSGLYYLNPRGLSTDIAKKAVQDKELDRVAQVYQHRWKMQVQYFATASDSKQFQSLLNLIGSIHHVNFNELGGIVVFDLGMAQEQLDYLGSIKKVFVQQLELTNPDLLKYYKADSAGRTRQGWSAWKFVALRQALNIFPYVLWIDSDFTVLQSLRPLFKYIQESEYFLCTIGDEKVDTRCKHPIAWGATNYVKNRFDLGAADHGYILDQEPVLSGAIGVSRKALDYLVMPLCNLTRDLKLFEDDGTASEGFGSGRSEETIVSVFAYLHGLMVHQHDYTQKNPIRLLAHDSCDEFYLTWHKNFINEKTMLYHSRSDLDNYAYYKSAIHFSKESHDVTTSSSNAAKIVALVPGRNEAVYLPQHLKALSLYVDAIVYLDDASEDNSIEVVQSIAADCKVERIIKKERWIRDEPGDRNRLLQEGRAIGGTHFVVLDVDEMFTANCLENAFLRKKILALEPGEQIGLVWIQLWRSLAEYRFDDSVWTQNYKYFIFCDDKQCSYSSDFLHTSRTPKNLNGKTYFLEGYEYGVLHFQFVNWRNLLIKQAWYRCLEHIRNPTKSIAEINALYAPSKDESNLCTAKVPVKWFSRYLFFNPAIYQKAEFWKEKEVISWFNLYGERFFEGLDIWDIDWEPAASIKTV